MLPDFPKIKSKLNQGTYRYIVKNFHQTPILSSMRKQIHFEGEGFSMDENEDVKSKYQKFSTSFQISNDDLLNRGPIVYVEGVIGAIEEMDEQGEKLVIDKMKEATEKSGNKIDAGGKITPDNILEMIEKMSISFDENGKHELAFMGGADVDEALHELKTNLNISKNIGK